MPSKTPKSAAASVKKEVKAEPDSDDDLPLSAVAQTKKRRRQRRGNRRNQKRRKKAATTRTKMTSSR